MKYNAEQSAQISADVKGKTIESMEWEEVGLYWVVTFRDGSEFCCRLMAELS